MDWHFPKSDLAGVVNIASYSRTIIEGERTISGLEIFAREVLQNSLDAAARDGSTPRKVTVRFNLHTLPANARNALYQAMNWNALKEHVSAAHRVSMRRMDRYQFPDPRTLDGRQMQMLEIHESDTIGLVGPDLIRREEEDVTIPGETPKAYRALCRDDARREKIALGAGGTFGLGKAVLWRASAIQTVLFFSRLSIPADGVVHRAAAQARLCNHYVHDQPFNGLGFGGKMRGEFCAPLRDNEAINFARQIGIDPRSQPGNIGTTILIPFWEPPDARRDDRGVAPVALLARYAARYFWPAIDDGRLEVVVTHGGSTANARDHLALYNPFVELYRRVRADQRGPRDAAAENINVAVPPGPPPLQLRESHTFVRCALALINPDVPQERVSDDLVSKVAEIRGQGMVIGYQRLTGTARVRPFVGLALGGRIADQSDAGMRGDMLLGYSEHVTHTRWDEEAEALTTWPQARPRVRNLLEKISGYFARNAGMETPPSTGDLSAVQQRLVFPGMGRGPIPPPPPTGTPHLRTRRFERDGDRYAFDIRARVDADKPPARLDVWVEAGIETGRASTGFGSATSVEGEPRARLAD